MLGIYNGVAFINSTSGPQFAANASIEVRRESDAQLASIFSDRAGVAPLSNPFNADTEGRFEFYAAGIDDGYSVKVTKDLETYTLNNQPIGTAQERDTADLDKIADQVLKIHIGGVAIDEETIFDGFFFDQNVTITRVTIYAREAPLVTDFTVDFLKAGIEEGAIQTLTAGAKKQSAAVSGLSYTDTQEFGMKVKSTGSENDPGIEISIFVHYHVDALT